MVQPTKSTVPRFIGVQKSRSGRWVAEIKDSSQPIRLWLGTFDTPEEAARAYDEAARAFRGENAQTNFVAVNPNSIQLSESDGRHGLSFTSLRAKQCDNLQGIMAPGSSGLGVPVPGFNEPAQDHPRCKCKFTQTEPFFGNHNMTVSHRFTHSWPRSPSKELNDQVEEIEFYQAESSLDGEFSLPQRPYTGNGYTRGQLTFVQFFLGHMNGCSSTDRARLAQLPLPSEVNQETGSPNMNRDHIALNVCDHSAEEASMGQVQLPRPPSGQENRHHINGNGTASADLILRVAEPVLAISVSVGCTSSSTFPKAASAAAFIFSLIAILLRRVGGGAATRILGKVGAIACAAGTLAAIGKDFPEEYIWIAWVAFLFPAAVVALA